MSPPKQRQGSGNWERIANKQQRKLVRVYNTWSADIRKKLANASSRGESISDQIALLERNLPTLEGNLVATINEGTTKAVRASAGRRFDTPEVSRELNRQLSENETMVKTALVPRMHERLLEEVALGKAKTPKQLQASFLPLQSAAASYAGAAWVAIFTVQQVLGKVRERERISEGKPIEKVRWVLDSRAEHCLPSPGYYGCPELAKEYPSWSQLPTVPAGNVTCRGNCRCHLETLRDGEWQRGVYDD